jgi:hypothetical protein
LNIRWACSIGLVLSCGGPSPPGLFCEEICDSLSACGFDGTEFGEDRKDCLQRCKHTGSEVNLKAAKCALISGALQRADASIEQRWCTTLGCSRLLSCLQRDLGVEVNGSGRLNLFLKVADDATRFPALDEELICQSAPPSSARAIDRTWCQSSGVTAIEIGVFQRSIGFWPYPPALGCLGADSAQPHEFAVNVGPGRAVVRVHRAPVAEGVGGVLTSSECWEFFSSPFVVSSFEARSVDVALPATGMFGAGSGRPCEISTPFFEGRCSGDGGHELCRLDAGVQRDSGGGSDANRHPF